MPPKEKKRKYEMIKCLVYTCVPKVIRFSTTDSVHDGQVKDGQVKGDERR
jgi:hypothetical protein